MLISTSESTSQEIQLEILTDHEYSVPRHNNGFGKEAFIVFPKQVNGTIIHFNTQGRDLGVALDSLHQCYCFDDHDP